MSPTQIWLGAVALGAVARRLGAIGSVGVAIRGADAVTALLAAAEARLVHDPGDAVATAAVSLFAEFHQNAGTPISLPAPGREPARNRRNRFVNGSGRQR